MKISCAAAMLLGAFCAIAFGDHPVITAFHGNGVMTWDHPGLNVESYRIEWASQAEGPYQTFEAGAQALDLIAPTGTTMSAAVPMFYRVVATIASQVVPETMLLIPAGTNSGTDPDFGPYSLTVEDFYMDRFEVTHALWSEVHAWAITNGYTFDNAGAGKAPDHPVHTVNWYDCVKWCNARSEMENRPPVYTVAGEIYRTGREDLVVQTAAPGYRLPTETEWVYAARGGVSGNRFAWDDSNDIQHARANYWSSSIYAYDTSPTREFHPDHNDGISPYTSPVASFAANAYGLFDMTGNVWEWCFDWHPDWVDSDRVLRGGSWGSNADFARVGRRDATLPVIASGNSGFRVVLTPASEP